MRKFFPIISVILILILVGSAVAQIVYSDPVFTSYTVANLNPVGSAGIIVTYYDANGVAQPWQIQRTVQGGGSVTIQQAVDDPDLLAGRYSAVVSSDQPIAAVVNQQLGTLGSRTSIAPFSSYSGSSAGATKVIIPEVLYNWFNYYTEFYIQNTGGASSTNVKITYTPTSIGACTTGAALVDDPVVTVGTPLAQYASIQVSQFAKPALGAPSVAGCTAFTGRFMGMAVITADQPIVVVVNQVTQNKLFTSNGFTASGTNLVVPAYLRNWYGYYASLTLANAGPSEASVQLVYTPSPGSSPSAVITTTHTVPSMKSINIYDGSTANASQSDLVTAYPYNPAFAANKQPLKFFGSIKLTSTQPILAKVNQESEAVSGNKAGAYNVPLTTDGTNQISVPLIQSDFYGYYTSLTIMTVDGEEATVEITYTSDNDFSTKKGVSKTYTLTTTNGFLNRYEGSSCNLGANQCDLFHDIFWDGSGTTTGRFIGSASIKVISGSNIVAYVNSESNTAPYAGTRDTMYTFNAFNLIP